MSNQPSSNASETGQDFYCPVCGRSIAAIQIWQDPDSDRIRMFCEDCSLKPEYSSLSRRACIILDYDGFAAFAARRFLDHVRGKERRRTS